MKDSISIARICMISLFLLVAFPWSGVAQENTVNQVLDNDIRTVQLRMPGAQLLNPIVDIHASNNTLVLQFDHLGDAIKDYSYTIVHCNSDWQPSELDDNQYIDGFTEDRITEIENSFNTLAIYTHYALGLPNSNMRWTKSGNYLLKVFDADDDKRLVLIRRFMVVEPQWQLNAQIVKTAMVSKLDTHHEIDFAITLKDNRVSNPQNDVKAFVLQNGRWDNAIGPIKPYITRGDQILYDYQDKIVFPAGKEFRFFDIRTFDYRGEFVKIITNREDYYEVTLQTDQSRADKPIIFRNDIDGRFVIENNNANQTLLQCDYATVLFSITQNQPLYGKDVYVFGELTDWELKPEFKMEYNDEAKMYLCEPFLKQGYYNYEYVVVDQKTGEFDEDGFEGNWYQTGNTYTILVYFRPFGARYDRLMTTVTIDSKTK